MVTISKPRKNGQIKPPPAEPPHKPPVGPVPEYIWREKRMWHLITHLAGYADQGDFPVQTEWLTELRQRLNEVLIEIERGNLPGSRPGGQP